MPQQFGGLGLMVIQEQGFARPRQQVQEAEDAVLLLREEMESYDREHMVCIPLDAKNRILGVHTVGIGALTTLTVHPREVFKIAVLSNAASLIILHNHPSGVPDPSAADLDITGQLVQAGEILGIQVLDHIIIGEERFYSIRDEHPHLFERKQN